eukprot:scaffold28_cov515-Prasinococcus_capsulatus_cf.AAC.18
MVNIFVGTCTGCRAGVGGELGPPEVGACRSTASDPAVRILVRSATRLRSIQGGRNQSARVAGGVACGPYFSRCFLTGSSSRWPAGASGKAGARGAVGQRARRLPWAIHFRWRAWCWRLSSRWRPLGPAYNLWWSSRRPAPAVPWSVGSYETLGLCAVSRWRSVSPPPSPGTPAPTRERQSVVELTTVCSKPFTEIAGPFFPGNHWGERRRTQGSGRNGTPRVHTRRRRGSAQSPSLRQLHRPPIRTHRPRGVVLPATPSCCIPQPRCRSDTDGSLVLVNVSLASPLPVGAHACLGEAAQR